MLAAAVSIMKYCQKASRNILDHLGQLDLKLGLIENLDGLKSSNYFEHQHFLLPGLLPTLDSIHIYIYIYIYIYI